MKNYIISLVIGIGIMVCGANIAVADNFEYIDGLEITDSFVDSELAWRISSTDIKNHGDSAVRKHGDSNVIYGSRANAEVVYAVGSGQEFIATAYLPATALAEDVFALEFSKDGQGWVTAHTALSEYLLDNEDGNVSGEPYRACILKAVVPDSCIYARVRWISVQWNYMLGEVELRNSVNYGDFYDDLTDFKTVSGTSLYFRKNALALTDGLDVSVIERTPYYCGQKHEFDADSTIVEKYGAYTSEQYLIYDLNSQQKNSVCVQTVYSEDVYILQMPFKFYAKVDGSWRKLEPKLRINGIRAAYYVEDVGEGAEQLKIVYPIEAQRQQAYIASVAVRPSGGIKAEISELAYFVDGERVFSTPDNYGDNTIITGVLSGKDAQRLVNPRIIAAAYDGAGVLVAVNSSALLKEVALGEEQVFTVEISDLNYKAENIKLFFWEGNVPAAVCTENVVYKPEEFGTASGTLTDNFEDSSKIWELSSGFVLEAADGEKTPGYSNIIRRDYNLRRAIKYRVHNAKSITINAFRFRKIGDIHIYASGYDGDYKEVIPVFSGNTHTADDWWTATYTVTELPENTSYIKIEIDKSSGASWTPVIAQAEINY